jgi:radical SAM/Cys-rich protein
MSEASFSSFLEKAGLDCKRIRLDTLQINITKKCNQACSHCHVESSPRRTEMISSEIIEDLLKLVELYPTISTVDITGGAPELHPQFRYLVEEFSKRRIKVIDRCNLTILFEPGQEGTAQFLADNKVEIAASLPCYLESNVNQQRGKGVFSTSIDAILLLNSLGYGQSESGLILNLVYNPLGDYLPPPQGQLEKDYKKELKERYEIVFNKLLTIANMPITRYETWLKRKKAYEPYMDLLVDNFNPTAAENVMCKSLLSIAYDGQVYDCDFNQVINLGLAYKKTYVKDLLKEPKRIYDNIATGRHCFACTAGSGSGCYGSTS